MSKQIVVHAGAWNTENKEEIRLHDEACNDAIKIAKEEFRKGTNIIDIAEKVINFFEDIPFTDAGTGSYLQLDGVVRMDASIMTSELKFGSVLQIKKTQHPISVARKILDYKYHNILTSNGATHFAREENFESYDTATYEQVMQWLSWKKDKPREISYKSIVNNYKEDFKKRLMTAEMGTVGCVIRDENGFIVAATSTGGLALAYPGRVGDSGLPGAGTYANKFGGASCTGDGEKAMVVLLTKTLVDYIEDGYDASKAAKMSIEKLYNETIGHGGIISIDHKGNIGIYHNTSYLASAHATID